MLFRSVSQSRYNTCNFGRIEAQEVGGKIYLATEIAKCSTLDELKNILIDEIRTETPDVAIGILNKSLEEAYNE